MTKGVSMSGVMVEQTQNKALTRDYLLTALSNEGHLSLESVNLAQSQSLPKSQSTLHWFASLALTHDKQQQLILDMPWLLQWLSNHTGLTYYPINPLKVKPSQITKVMSHGFAKKHKILAVEVDENHVKVATADPFDQRWLANLEHILNQSIEVVIADPDDILRFIDEFYTLAQSVVGANQGVESNQQGIEAFMELGSLTSDTSDQHIVTIVDWLFQYAFDQRASDIHIEPRKQQGFVRFRIDGVLHHIYDMPMKVLLAVVSRIKTLGRMNIAEKRKPQDGRLKTKTPQGVEIDLRLSTIPTAFGEKLVLRIFDPEVLLKSFHKLGFSSQESQQWEKMTQQNGGIILVTGPTGSGKTTTLYSTLRQLAQPEVNVCTIEDPIEMIEDKFNQMQVHPSIGLNFADGVKALLRQDPDIIMIGEIRDSETAQMAVQAALTGHLVISTLHTNDAPSAITRLIEIGLPSYLIKATLIGVMAQRLVRVLCSQCKVPAEISIADWSALTAPFKLAHPEVIFKPMGCLQCRNTGFQGRVGIYEILSTDSQFNVMIDEQLDLNHMKKNVIQKGMKTLRLSGALKVIAGTTSVEEVLRVAPPPFN